MRTLTVFNQTSINGCIADASGDMSFAHRDDPEWNAWVQSNASGGGELVFGRVTYEQMASWWPSAMARQAMPALAERMNQLPKVVFSRSLKRADWHNTRLIEGDLPRAIAQLKREPGPGLVVMGSGSIVSQLAEIDAIDTLQVVINPLILGGGKAMFGALPDTLAFERSECRTFQNGNVALTYQRRAAR